MENGLTANSMAEESIQLAKGRLNMANGVKGNEFVG